VDGMSLIIPVQTTLSPTFSSPANAAQFANKPAGDGVCDLTRLAVSAPDVVPDVQKLPGQTHSTTFD
jgi:hypothetical protein